MYKSQRWRAVVCGVKGDMPFLAKCGKFQRHWLRAQKKESSNTVPKGVCHLCMASTPQSGPFEDFNEDCEWARTPITVPWTTQPTVLRLFHSLSQPWTCFRPDLWHNFHGGVGKDFLASAITEAMSCLLSGTKDERCREVADLLCAWSKRPGGKLPHSGHFSAARISLTSWQVRPKSVWSKHDDTRIYCAFLAHWLNTRAADCASIRVMSLIKLAVDSINKMFTELFSSGLWLTGSEAQTLGGYGRTFCTCYGRLAALCYDERRLRFNVTVKLHQVDHTARRLISLGGLHPFVINPLCESVQMDEAPQPTYVSFCLLKGSVWRGARFYELTSFDPRTSSAIWPGLADE